MRALLWTVLACGAPHAGAPTEPAPAEVPMSTSLTVELRGGTFAAGAPARIAVRVTNPTLSDQEFCTYHTPFEGIRNHIFEVRSGDTTLPYRGVLAKRAPPTRADVRTLTAGQSTEWVEVDLGDAYNLEPGVYSVRFIGGPISLLPDSAAVALTIR